MLIRYPGGKKKLSKSILPLLIAKPSQRYVEPFFGAGGFFDKIVAQFDDHEYFLNDLDYSICCLWNAIKDRSGELTQLIREFKPSVDKFREFKEILLTLGHSTAPIEEIALQKMAVHQMSYSGLGVKAGSPIGGFKQESKYPVDCRWNPGHLIQQVEKLSGMFGSIRLTEGKIHNLTFGGVLDRCDEHDICYLDPPYYVQGDGLYNQRMEPAQHIELGRRLQNAPYQWILSYDDCPFVIQTYAKSNIKPVSNYNSINNKGHKDELIITNIDTANA